MREKCHVYFQSVVLLRYIYTDAAKFVVLVHIRNCYYLNEIKLVLTMMQLKNCSLRYNQHSLAHSLHSIKKMFFFMSQSILNLNEEFILWEEFEDSKGIIWIRKIRQTTQWPKEKGQNDKHRSTKHTHKTNLTKNLGWTQVLRKGKQFLLH